MAVELATAYIALVPSMKGFSGAVAQEMSTVGQVAGASSSRGFLSTIGGAVSGVVGVTAKATGLIGGLVGGLALKGGISRQLQIEDATAKLSGLGNSAESVTTIMSNAMASVKGTAFGMGEAATVAAGAVAAGIKPGQDLERILKLTGDSATIAGTSMGEMGGIFNKVASSGKVTGDVVAQLQDRGFPILQMLADKYGITAEAASKMVSEGKVNFADFASSIEKNVGGAALKSGDTTKGAFANMNAALSRVGVTMSSGFFPLFKSVFNQVTLILDGVNAKVKPAAEAFGIWFQGKANPVIASFASTTLAKFDTLIGGLRALVAAFKDGGDDVTSSGFAGGMERIGLAARHVTDWIVPMAIEVRGGFRAMAAAFQDGGDDVTSSGFAGVMERIGLIARQVWDGAQPMFAAITQGWRDMMAGFSTGDFSGVGGSLVSVFSAIGPLMQPMGTVLVAVGQNIGDFAGALGELIAGALTLVAPMVRALADGFKWLGDHSELIPPILIALGGALLVFKTAQAAANMAELFALPIKAASVVANLSLAAANNALADATLIAAGAERQGFIARLPAVAQVIAKTAVLVANSVATFAVSAAMGVATAAQWLWNAAMSANPIALIVIAIVALVAGIIWVATQTTFFQDVWAAMCSFIGTAWDAVVTGLTTAFTAVAGFIGSMLGNIGNFFADTWNNILSFLGTVWTAMVGAVVGYVTWYFTTIFDGFNAVWNFIVGLFTSIGQFFSDTWNNIVNGVVGFVTWYFTTIFNAFTAVWNFIGDVLGNIGRFFSDTWNNIINGVSGFIGNLVGFFSGLPGQIMGVLGNIGGWLVDAGKSLIQGFIDGIKGMVGAIGDAVGGVLDFTKQFFPHSPAKRGPFSGTGYTSFSGQALAKDFAAGIASQNDLVADAAAGIMTSASLTGHVGISSALLNNPASRSGTVNNWTINQVDDPIGTAHAVTRRQLALSS